MKNKRGILIVLMLCALGLFVLSFSFGSAIVSVGNKSHEITKAYGPGASLQGWINISLSQENSGNLFTDNKGNSIKLIDALRSDILLKEGTNYNCTIPGCGIILSGISGTEEQSKNFLIEWGEEKIIGFALQGNITKVSKADFSISSNARTECVNQLEIAFFEEDNVIYKNSNFLNEPCGEEYKTYGCFNKTKASEQVLLDNIGYCQKIRLNEAPGFKLGAWMNVTSGAKNTNISIYDLELNKKADCSLGNSTGEGEKSCFVEYHVSEPKDYYICIYSTGTVTDSSTKILRQEGTCGFYNRQSSSWTYTHAYQIFAEQMKFNTIGEINMSLFFEEDIKTEFENFIASKYGSSCPATGCIIPMFIKSGKDFIWPQNIQVGNIDIEYVTTTGPLTTTSVFELNYVESNINSNGSIKLSLDNFGFVLPTTFGNTSYSLKLGEGNIFTETITIERVPQINHLSPTHGFNEIPIDFTISVQEVDNASITNYVWEFGNSSPQATTTNTVKHTFSNTGTFPIRITVTDAKGKTSTRTFNFEVKDYRGYFFEKKDELKTRIEKITEQIDKFPVFIQQGIKKVIDPAEEGQKIAILEEKSLTGLNKSDILDFLNIDMKVPISVFEGMKLSSINFYVNPDVIEPSIVASVAGGTYDSSKANEYKQAIATWNLENADVKATYHRIDAQYQGNRVEPILNVFEMDVTRKGTGTIFLKQLENIAFKAAYGEKLESNYINIPLETKKIEFYTTEKIEFTDLPFFISGSLDKLMIIKEYGEAERQRMKWTLFITILFFLLLAGVIVYIIMQQWYKHRYEDYLFKNKNYLFNLINYIDNENKKGTEESQIFKNLKKSGWNSEQINYVMRKYVGKRTGMLEIPIEKLLKGRSEAAPQRAPLSPGDLGPRPKRFPPRRF